MSDHILLDQFIKLMDALPPSEPWPILADSGFLDLLREESDGGAGLMLEDLFEFAIETGRRANSPPVLETMAARLVDAEAVDVADVEPQLGRALAAVLDAGQMAGAMAEIEWLTVDYAMQRQQFGREIGKFQAVQHQLAVLAEEVMAARIAAQAAFKGAPQQVSEKRAAVAKFRAGQASVQVCQIAHAIHGAIGVSAEHVLHQHTSRLRAWRLSHGGDAWWARKLGQFVCSEGDDITTLARRL